VIDDLQHGGLGLTRAVFRQFSARLGVPLDADAAQAQRLYSTSFCSSDEAVSPLPAFRDSTMAFMVRARDWYSDSVFC
jgi:hypothetical protein